MEKIFYTITDEFTEHTNSRSKRFYSMNAARNAARKRLEKGSLGVYILQSVCLISAKDNSPKPNLK